MRRFITLSLIFGLAACSDSTAPKADSFSGDYALATVDGHPLPVYSMSFEGGNYYIASIQVHLETEGRLAPYYVAVERDSVAFADGKPIVTTSSYGGGLTITADGSLSLANFTPATGKGKASPGVSFTVPTTLGLLQFNRID